MSITKIFLKRPVFATVVNLIIFVVGLIIFFKIETRSMPNIDPPVVNINSTYFGSDAAYMEKYVTTPIEKAITSISNIESVQSSSSSGFSSISIEFVLGTDMNDALNDVRAKIYDISSQFPKNMDFPNISKIERDSFPSLWLAIESSEYDGMTLTDIANQRIKPVLEKINEVAIARVYSSSSYAIQIKLSPEKLYQFKLAPSDIIQIINSQNKDYPSGNLTTEHKNYIINLHTKIDDVDGYKNIIISNIDGKIIRLSDIADIEMKPTDPNNILKYNGKNSVAIGLIRDSTSNTIDMSNRVIDILDNIQESLPKEIKISVAYDQSVPLKQSIKEVYVTFLEALILISIVVYFFLGTPLITLVPLVTIPVSIIGAISLMKLAGFSLNLYSLLAMVLAIGLVVDDAIVMLENIFRHIEKGLKPFEAANKALEEITFAIIAMTLTLASVFLPIGFIDGFVGKLFIEFAWTLAFTVLISGITALTLTPTLTSNILTKFQKQTPPKIVRIFNIFIYKLRIIYISYLRKSLENKKIIIIFASIAVIILAGLLYFIPNEFMPEEDNSIILISASGPEGMSIDEAVKTSLEIEKIISKIPEVEGYFLNISAGSIFSFVPLKPWNNRKRSQFDIAKELNIQLSQIPSMMIHAMNPSSMRGTFSKPIEISVQSFTDYEQIDIATKLILDKLREDDNFTNEDRNYKTSTPTIKLDINRDYASKLNISIEDISKTLRLLLSGEKITDFSIGNELYPVIMNLNKSDRNQLSSVNKIFVKSRSGEMINISNITNISETTSIESLDHYNNVKSIKVDAQPAQNVSMKDAVNALNDIIDKYVDKETIKIEYLGDIKRMSDSNMNIIFTFALALIFIYLVLAAQFESFKDPFIILCSVPFSMVGGILLLYVFSSSLNLYSNIGLITLIGLITKNALMIVEFRNQLFNQGMSNYNAIIESCKLRFRPILMTTIATSFGAIPLIISSGAGAESRKSIGLVIFGGMLIGTFFTLFIIPAIVDKVKK